MSSSSSSSSSSSRMSAIVASSCFFILPSLLQATPLTKLAEEAKYSGRSVRIASSDAHDFLLRPRRSAEPKWYQNHPDFQSYYRYYSSIGHMEGLYEIDKIRMLYQQMRYLEQTYGVDGFGIPEATSPPPTTKPPPPPPPPPTARSPSLSQSDFIYLCNPKDPLCKPRIVYVPTGAVVVPCDPRYHPSCKLSASPEDPAETPEPRPTTTAPPAPKPPSIFRGTQYDCDPYWDPDCLIENPPIKPLLINKSEEHDEEDNPASSSNDRDASYYRPYDYYRDLYDPYHHGNPGPGS